MNLQTDITLELAHNYTCYFGDLAAMYFTNVFSDIIHLQMRCPFQLHFWKKMFF